VTTVVIASYFEEEFVRRIREVDGRLRVLYREDLVPPPMWPGDHVGPEDWSLTPAEEEEFLVMLSEAEVLYDFPRGHVRDLMRVAPKLRWLQGSLAGAGEVAQKAGLQETDVVVTTASGIYSGPLAEFVLMAMLQHAKDLDRLRRDKAEKVWRKGATGTLERKTLCVVGTGSIGRAIAGRARPFGMRVVGVKRTVREDDAAWEYADELYATGELRTALSEADFVAVTLPGTPETQHLLDAEAIASMKPGAYFSNVGRGAVVDEAALHRLVGGRQVLRAQLVRLAELLDLPNVTVQVLDDRGVGHAAANGPFNILRFAAPDLPDVVYLEQLTSALYLDKRADVDRYALTMNRLVVEADTPARTQDILAGLLRSL